MSQIFLSVYLPVISQSATNFFAGYLISALGLIMQISVLGIITFGEWWLSNWLTTAEKPVAERIGVGLNYSV